MKGKNEFQVAYKFSDGLGEEGKNNNNKKKRTPVDEKFEITSKINEEKEREIR